MVQLSIFQAHMLEALLILLAILKPNMPTAISISACWGCMNLQVAFISFFHLNFHVASCSLCTEMHYSLVFGMADSVRTLKKGVVSFLMARPSTLASTCKVIVLLSRRWLTRTKSCQEICFVCSNSDQSNIVPVVEHLAAQEYLRHECMARLSRR